jgi:alpha-L-fucosidase 2
MKWSGGKLQQAVIRPKIGGTLRLRSYVPLKGKGLKLAQGACPNDLLRPAAIQQPLRSAELSNFETLPIRKVYEYDVETVAGSNIICNLLND